MTYIPIRVNMFFMYSNYVIAPAPIAQQLALIDTYASSLCVPVESRDSVLS